MEPVGRKTFHHYLRGMGRTKRIMNLLVKVLVMALPTAISRLTTAHIHACGLKNGEIIDRDSNQLTTAKVLIHAHSRSRQEQEDG